MANDPIDPVCGMQVDKDSAAAQVEYKGETYYFCAIGCKERFEENPEKFIERIQEPQKQQ
ncbi:MAG: YHS domain-containing protein [Armatimonadetes bacterium]|nr:YHS domain-containing protein [Armatimonadota bacterium]NIM23230.1 YHS domain-containing protein [Armatimonadota bacterium]NIM67098.1 YHS domain-containing protein [Armatimonadota bacterium]NIM75625.1 YHS domain-containing protein [Armatimonadota bacterium]NIN05287.1 YHS domain-containing protein [Armatimonadota bacterium]